jgi:hypothetical protein
MTRRVAKAATSQWSLSLFANNLLNKTRQKIKKKGHDKILSGHSHRKKKTKIMMSHDSRQKPSHSLKKPYNLELDRTLFSSLHNNNDRIRIHFQLNLPFVGHDVMSVPVFWNDIVFIKRIKTFFRNWHYVFVTNKQKHRALVFASEPVYAYALSSFLGFILECRISTLPKHSWLHWFENRLLNRK